ncbi:macrolide transporter subunit MacA [soil metagenome]
MIANRFYEKGIFLALAIVIVGCGSSSSETTTSSSSAQPMTAPTSAKAETRDIVGYDMLQDAKLFIPPSAEAVIYPRYSGPVEQVMTSVGQRVSRNDVLIQLNFPNAKAAYDQAQQAVRDAETAYKKAEISYSDPVKQADTALTDARAAERAAREQALTSGDGTALADATAQRKSMESAVATAKLERKGNLQSYQDQIDMARDAMQQAKSGVKLGSVKSPISGTVTMLNVKAGQTIGSSSTDPIAKVVDLGAIKVKAIVPATSSPKVEEGKNVTISFTEITDQAFEGKVSRVQVLPSNGKGPLTEVTIDFRNDEGQIKDGFHVRWVGVKVGEQKDVLAVPANAIKTDSTGKPTVMVLDGTDWKPRVVETGLSDGQYTQIKSGLKEGETVQVAAAK